MSYFYDLDNPGTIGVLYRVSRDTRTLFCKAHETGSVPGRPVQWVGSPVTIVANVELLMRNGRESTEWTAHRGWFVESGAVVLGVLSGSKWSAINWLISSTHAPLSLPWQRLGCVRLLHNQLPSVYRENCGAC